MISGACRNFLKPANPASLRSALGNVSDIDFVLARSPARLRHQYSDEFLDRTRYVYRKGFYIMAVHVVGRG